MISTVVLHADLVTYTANFIAPEIAGKMFENLRKELNWERRADAPRYEYWTNTFGRPYTYGRGAGVRTYQSQADHPDIMFVRKMLLNIIPEMYEGCFLNMYDGDKDWLGWHADDDPGIDHNRPIAIVTLYPADTLVIEQRCIEFKKIGEKGMEAIKTQPLEQGSLCLMHAGMQQTHYHRIPKASGKVRPRISLTFRGLIPMRKEEEK